MGKNPRISPLLLGKPSLQAWPSSLPQHRRGFNPWGMLSCMATIPHKQGICTLGAPHLASEMWVCRPGITGAAQNVVNPQYLFKTRQSPQTTHDISSPDIADELRSVWYTESSK